MESLHTQGDGEVTFRDAGRSDKFRWKSEFLSSLIKVEGASGQYDRATGFYHAILKQECRNEFVGARPGPRIYPKVSFTFGFRRFSDFNRPVVHDLFHHTGGWKEAISAVTGIWAFNVDILLRGQQLGDSDTWMLCEKVHCVNLHPLVEEAEMTVVTAECEILGAIWYDQPTAAPAPS